jgi:hypothetical protein
MLQGEMLATLVPYRIRQHMFMPKSLHAAIQYDLSSKKASSTRALMLQVRDAHPAC